MTFQTKFWFKADAVISAESKTDAWRRIAQLAANAAEGHPTRAGFLAGEMSVEPNGQHLTGPRRMTEAAEDLLVVMYHKKVIEQGVPLALGEIPDPVYSMMIGFAIAHDLLVDDARKLAHAYITAIEKQAIANDHRAPLAHFDSAVIGAIKQHVLVPKGIAYAMAQVAWIVEQEAAAA